MNELFSSGLIGLVSLAASALLWLGLRRTVRGPVALPLAIIGAGFVIGLGTILAISGVHNVISRAMSGELPAVAPLELFGRYGWIAVLGGIIGGGLLTWRGLYSGFKR